MLLVICAWCGADLGWKPGEKGLSHGICRDCCRRHLVPEIGLLKNRTLSQRSRRDPICSSGRPQQCKTIEET